MIPAAFDYVRAHSVEEAISLVASHGDDAKLLAGGHSLLPLMKLRLANPAVLVDVGHLQELGYVRDEGDHVAIGALTRYRDLAASAVLDAQVPIVAHVAGRVGDPQVRHRGTIGGSVAHADPAADLPAVLLALRAQFVVHGPAGQRRVAAADFYLGFLETALRPDEVLTEIRVPKSVGGWSYQKLSRRAIDWATVAVAAVRTDGTLRVALVNMGSVPLPAAATEGLLAQGASAAEAAAAADEGTNPPSDLNASAEYRKHLARVLTRRALEDAGC